MPDCVPSASRCTSGRGLYCGASPQNRTEAPYLEGKDSAIKLETLYFVGQGCTRLKYVLIAWQLAQTKSHLANSANNTGLVGD